ncbi:hypothetical protein Tco_1381045, partial [Tanacetum coccineum]
AAEVDFGDIDFSKLHMGGGDGFDAEGDAEEVKEEEAIGKQEVAPPIQKLTCSGDLVVLLTSVIVGTTLS